MPLQGYYDRYDASKNYVKTLFRAAKGLQSAELNEVQDYAIQGLKEIGDSLFKDGDVISGCTCVVDSDTGDVTVESGKVYITGAIRRVGVGNLTIPTNIAVKIGVYYKEHTITELDDPELRDPALGTRNYQEAGGGRLQYTLTWGYFVDGVTEQNSELGDFYPIYNVTNGVLIQNAPAPQLDSVSESLARYDNESNGSYVVDGMKVSCLSSTGGNQVFSIGAGKCHVNGYEVELSHSLRKSFAIDADVATVQSDPYQFNGDAQGNMTVNVNQTPIATISRVSITAEKTATITHGAYSGSSDVLPDTSILSVISVIQGGTTYTPTDDYVLNSGAIDWSPSGAEPAPSSTYSVTYRYMKTVEPTDVTDTSFKVNGAVDGSNVLVDYSYKMARYDIITVDYEGNIHKIKGVAQRKNPSIPSTPSGQLKLADVYQTWFTDTVPTVKNNAIKAVLMSDLEGLQRAVGELQVAAAEQQLRIDANASDPAAKRGIFVDPFLDDDMRDQGIEQTGAIVNGELMLPIFPTITDLGKQETNYILPYELEPVVSQELFTGYMKINPYQAFDPIPADVKITLDVDRWTTTNTVWLSPVTYRYSGSSSYTTSYSQLVSSSNQNAEYMREVSQSFSIKGFKPGEALASVKFNDVEIEVTAED